MKRKYELTSEMKTVKGHKVYRIRYLIDILAKNIVAGQLGGFLESEMNLEHAGTCVVMDEATVLAGSVIKGDARVLDRAIINFNSVLNQYAVVKDDAYVSNSSILEHAMVQDFAQVTDDCVLAEYAKIKDNAKISSRSEIMGYSVIGGKARISTGVKLRHSNFPTTSCGTHINGDVEVINGVEIKDEVQVRDCAVCDQVLLSGKVIVKDKAVIKEHSIISEEAIIKDNSVVKKGKISGKVVVAGQSLVENSKVTKHAIILDSKLQHESHVSNEAKVTDSVLSGVLAHNNVVIEESTLKGEDIHVSGYASVKKTKVSGNSRMIAFHDDAKVENLYLVDVLRFRVDKEASLLAESQYALQLAGSDYHFTDSCKIMVPLARRIYFMTGDVKLKNYATIIGDFFFNSKVHLSEFASLNNKTSQKQEMNDIVQSGDFVYEK